MTTRAALRAAMAALNAEPAQGPPAETFASLCDRLEQAMLAHDLAALRIEEAAIFADTMKQPDPRFDALYRAEGAAGRHRAALLTAVAAWPPATPAEAVRKLRLAVGELRGDDDFGARLARVAMLEAAQLLAASAADAGGRR